MLELGQARHAPGVMHAPEHAYTLPSMLELGQATHAPECHACARAPICLIFLAATCDACTRILYQGFTSIPDTFYWSLTTVLGGADKAPVSIGGKVLFFCFFLIARVLSSSAVALCNCVLSSVTYLAVFSASLSTARFLLSPLSPLARAPFYFPRSSTFVYVRLRFSFALSASLFQCL